MVKKKTEVVSNDDFEAALKSEPQVFDTIALGVAKTSEGYSVIKVMLDSKTLETGSVEVTDTAESKWEANEKFKIRVIKEKVL